VDRFLTRAAELIKLHSGTLARLREALQGLGLEKLQERLAASAGGAVEAASRLWEEWEAKDVKTVVDSLKLKADEVLADPQMREAFNAGIARLNCMVLRAEGFDGQWVGKEDGELRCIIKDATILWNWGEETELEIWGSDTVSTMLQDEAFRGRLLPDGGLEWSDGDCWVRREDPAAAAKEGATAAASDVKEAAPDAGSKEDADESSNLALIQQSLGSLRRVVGGDGLEGDVEEALGALARVANSDGEVQRIVQEMSERRELLLDLRGKVMQSKTCQVLQEGQTRLTQQLSKLQETSITPQLERVQHRSQRFIARLTTDKKVKSKAAELFTAAQSRLSERWNDPNDPQRGGLESWVTSVKDRVVGQLGMHRVMLVESLGGLDLQQVDLRQLVANSWDPAALEAQLELSLLRAIKLSGIESSGTELLDRFESTSSVAQLPALQRTYQGLLGTLGDLNVEVPMPIRKLLEAQAAGSSHDANTWKEAIVSSLDDDSVVSGASELIKKGEMVLTQFQDIKSSKAVARVMEHLENEDIERELLKKLHGLDPQEMLSSAEGALSSSEKREALVSQLKDACLDFILKILPAISIEKVSGNHNGCDWEISDISFSDFSFRKENVHIALGDQTCRDQELLRVSAWDISAHFRKLKVTAKQTHFPFIEAGGVAEAKAERMSVAFAFKLQPGVDGGTPSLAMSSRSVLMDSLELWVENSNYAVIVNALSFLFADVLKEYACQKIGSYLDDHMGTLIGALNSAIITCLPLLAKLGVAPASLVPAGAAAAAAEPEEEPLAVDGRQRGQPPQEEDGLPLEIDWADPGRSLVLRA